MARPRSQAIASLVRSLACAIAFATACDSPVKSPASPKSVPIDWIVAVDLSASRQPAQLDAAQTLVSTLATSIHNGDRMTILRVYEHGLADDDFLWTWDVPPAHDPARVSISDSLQLEKASRALRAEIPSIFDPGISGKLMQTDLFATLFRVADLARGDGTRAKRLVLISDMLHSSGGIDMERFIPDTDWVTRRVAEGRIPRLDGVCVVVAGPDVSAASSARLLSFWRAYFRAAGADFHDENYRNYFPDLESIRCS